MIYSKSGICEVQDLKVKGATIKVQYRVIKSYLHHIECNGTHFGDGCKSKCQCENEAVCDSSNGKCSCLPGWRGVYCQSSKYRDYSRLETNRYSPC